MRVNDRSEAVERTSAPAHSFAPDLGGQVTDLVFVGFSKCPESSSYSLSFAEGLDDRGWSKSGGWQAEIRLLSALIDKLNGMEPKPRFFIICGDLVDAYPMDEPRRSQQEADFKGLIKFIRARSSSGRKPCLNGALGGSLS